MTSNVGRPDRIARLALALLAIVVAIVTGPSSVLGIVLFAVAGILAVTAVVGFCPLYRLLGVTTCPVDRG